MEGKRRDGDKRGEHTRPVILHGYKLHGRRHYSFTRQYERKYVGVNY